MNSFRHTAFAVLLCLGLVPLAACTRTSDGTVVLKKPPAMPNLMPSFFRRADNSRFPPAPQPEVQSAAPVTAAKPKPSRRKSSYGPITVAPTEALTCKNVVQPDGRIQIVCK